MSSQKYDYIIIGSGFGGSVCAMRLAEKGYKVLVLEMGRRWRDSDFPKTNRNIFKYLWAPKLLCYGIQKISLLKGLMLLHGVGVGGGSLVYANTLMQPEDEIFKRTSWPKNIRLHGSLEKYFNMGRKMLGVTTNPKLFEMEGELFNLSKKMGVEKTFHPTQVGVYFNENSKDLDPYFSGKGPLRRPCTFCGGCMIGCREGAKNTLEKNYLYFAEKFGTSIVSEVAVDKIIPKDSEYEVRTRSSTKFFLSKEVSYVSRNVIVAAGVMGTLKLLFKNRDVYKTLPNISQSLGRVVRTNGESLLGTTSFDAHRNFSKGIAIGAAFHPNEFTKIEGVKFPSGSDFLKFLAVPLTGDGSVIGRPIKLVGNVFKNAFKILKLHLKKDWAKQSMILLVMQSIDTQLNLIYKKGFFSRLQRSKDQKSLPSFLPLAQNACKVLSESVNGFAQNTVSEVVLSVPATAHILGGACMGENASQSVVDSNHEVFGHKGLFVCDGSVIPENLAVNPSLTIVALAERFMESISAKEN